MPPSEMPNLDELDTSQPDWDNLDEAELDTGDELGELDEPEVAIDDESEEVEEAPAEEEPAAEEPEEPEEPVAEEPAEEPEAPPAPKDDAESQLIPRARYNEIRKQREAAEARAREAEQRQAELNQRLASLEKLVTEREANEQRAKLEADLTALDVQIEEARADGNATKAAELRGQQRALERQLDATPEVSTTQEQRTGDAVQGDTSDAAVRALEALRVENMVGKLEADFPILAQDDPSFDQDKSDEVMDMYDVLLNKYPAAQALEKAAKYVMSAYGIKPASEVQAAAPTKKTDVKRKLEAAKAQPPQMGKAGYDSNKAGVQKKHDVMHMTQEQFEKLTEAEIEAMLGNEM